MWGVDLYINGRRVWHNLGPEERPARVAELRLRADLEEGRRPTGARGIGLRDQAEAWLARKEAEGTRVQSLSVYRGRVAHLTRYFGDIPLPDLRVAHVRRFAQDLSREGLAGATVNGVLAALGSVFGHARMNGVDVQRLDLAGIRLPVTARSNHLTIEECRLVVSEAPEPWRSACELALLTGLRKGEIMALSTGDVERDRPVLHVRGTLTYVGSVNPPKTRSGLRAVTLSPRAHALALERCAQVREGRLFPGRLNDADKALRAVLDGLGLHVPGRGWHSFRHAHTALLNEAGVALRDAAARLGHGANMAQSMAYGWASEHLDVGVIDDAITRRDRVREP